MNPEKLEGSRFAPLEHWREQQQLVSQELNQLAQVHEKRSGGMLTALPDDPELYPAQKITTQSISGEPVDLNTLTELGRAINLDKPDRFNTMISEFLLAEEQQQLVTSLGEDLLAGQNIIVITNHSQIQDIAEVLGACHVAIKNTGQQNQREYEFSTNIMLSKMVAHLGFYGTPATELLQNLCDKQYFSFPKTDSIRNSNIPEKLVEAYNWSLKQRVHRQFKRGNNLFGIAPSGTVDKALDDSTQDQFTLGPVTKGTVNILTNDNTKVLPIAVYKSSDEFIFEILGVPRHMRDADDVHQTMESIASVLSVSSKNKSFIYKNHKKAE